MKKNERKRIERQMTLKERRKEVKLCQNDWILFSLQKLYSTRSNKEKLQRQKRKNERRSKQSCLFCSSNKIQVL